MSNTYYRLLIPHVSQRGNYFPRGVYHENSLPPEIIKSERVVLDRTETENLNLPQENLKLVEIKKEFEKEQVAVEEQTEIVQATKVETKSPKVSKTKHGAKEIPEEITQEIKQPNLKETQETPIKNGKPTE